MIRKILLMCLIAVLAVQGVVLAKKKPLEIPPEDRVRIAVEVIDSTNFNELATTKILRDNLITQLDAKNMFNIVTKINGENYSELKSLGDRKGASDVGDIIMFNPSQNSYKVKSNGAQYVIYCNILGLGTASEFADSFDLEPGFGLGIGSGGDFGFRIIGGAGSRKRMIYGTVASVQFVEVSTGNVIFRRNVIGQAIRHRKPSKGYDDSSDEAYFKSIKDVAETVTKRVNDYAKKNLYKQDKSK